MAKFKIEQVNSRVNTGTVPNVSAVKLPVSLASVQSQGFSSIGQAVEKIYNDQREEENDNEFFKLQNEINPKILESYNKNKSSTNSKSALEAFTNDINYENFKDLGSNKAVKKKVEKYLNKINGEYSLKLLGEVYDNSIQASKKNKSDQLSKIVQTLGGSDYAAIPFAQRDLDLFFSNPNNEKFYGAEEIEKLKEKTFLEIKELQYINLAKNRNINLFDKEVRDNLNNELNSGIVDKIIDTARNVKLADIIKDEQDEMFREEQTLQSRIVNFTSFLQTINNFHLNKSEQAYAERPAIDDLYDAKERGAISSAQYNTLLRFYSDGNAQDDEVISDIVNAQLSIATTVDELDSLQRDINLNEKFASKLSPDGIIKYNKLVDKYKEDTEFAKDHKYFTETLKDVTGFINNQMAFIALPGATGSDAKKRQNQMKASSIIAEYNELVLSKNFSPEDAYSKVLKRLSKNQLPRLQDMAQPSGVAVNYDQALQDDPNKFFEKLRNEAADKFDLNRDIEFYKTDIERIDRLEDVFKTRLSIMTKEEAFK